MSLTSYRAAPPRVGGVGGGGGQEDLAAADSPATWVAVPWALGVFTAEFGMGSGGSPPAKATRSSCPPRWVPGVGAGSGVCVRPCRGTGCGSLLCVVGILSLSGD